MTTRVTWIDEPPDQEPHWWPRVLKIMVEDHIQDWADVLQSVPPLRTSSLIEAITSYEQRLIEQMGLHPADIGAAPLRDARDPRSGYALEITGALRRAAAADDRLDSFLYALGTLRHPWLAPPPRIVRLQPLRLYLNGAPGLLGETRSEAELRARQRAAYGPYFGLP